MAVLAILQADARVAARVSGALTADHDVTVCHTWEGLRATLEAQAFDGCLVDAGHPSRKRAMSEIASLRECCPAVAIVVCADLRDCQGYYDLGGLGVDGVLPAGDLNKVRVRSLVEDALATARAEGISRALRGRYAEPAPDAIGWAVENAGADTSVEKLAAALGHTPRSLRQALEEAGFPNPTRVLLWGRLLLAGARLSRDGRTVEDVAFSLGYSTATSLARAMKRQTGLTPKEVSQHGGMERVRDVLFSKGGVRGRRTHVGKIASLVAWTWLTTACAGLGIGSPPVDRGAIDTMLDSGPVARAHFGVLVVDAESGRAVYRRNEQAWFVPASNQKLLTAAAAWSLLGPDHRFRTEVWATGAVRSGRLDGDLVLVGSGDPSLSGRYWVDDTAPLAALADSVRARGVEHASGALLVDLSAWDSASVAPTREEADLALDYGSTASAFAFAEGELQVVVRAGDAVGAPAEVSWTPVGTRNFVTSLVSTSAPDSSTRVSAKHLAETHRLLLEGSVPLGVVDTLAFAQREPARQATAAFARELESNGITLAQGVRFRWTEGERLAHACQARTVHDCPGAEFLAALESPPVSRLLADVLGPSQNWIAEQLTLALGAEYGAGGSWDEGITVIERFLRDSVGVDSLDVAMRDGSGLSAYNLLTPRAVVRVLQFMGERDDAASFREALAEPGEVDSTLEERLLELRGRVFAKTGSISNANSLSGYLRRDDGRELIFSILSNGSALSTDEMRGTIDDIVRVLAR